MNVFHKVTIETIKKNKIRTLVTIIGIMLSTALIFSVTTSLYSFICFGKDMAIYETGDWHGMALPLTQDRVDELRDDPKIDEVFCLNAIGYADTGVKSSFSPKGEKNNYNFTVVAADDECFEKLPYYLKSGRYPENDSEIIISNSFFIRDIDDEFKAAGKGEIGLGSTFDMDMTIDLSSGIDDISLDEPDTGKLLKKASEITGTHKSYTIVGIYEEMYFNDLMEDDIYSIMCLTRGDSKSDNGIYTAYFKMKKAGNTSDYLNQHFNFNEERNAGINTKANDELLQFSLSGATASAGFLMSIFMIGAFILGLIMFGSVALIYNAFAISVSERTKQFGLLSSIGATKKQINRMIEFEALLLSLIGIPLGILLGYCGIGITFKALGSRFDSITGMINDSNALSLKLHVSWAVILITILVAEFTVRFSAWLPSVRAQRISAVDAIRQSGDIKAKNKRIRTPKLIYKFFGLPGVLAQKYFKRSKKRYRATVWSLFMSITLFVSASAFTSYLVNEIEEEMQTESYDIMYQTYFHDEDEGEKLFEKFKEADDIKDAAVSELIESSINISEDLRNEDLVEFGNGYDEPGSQYVEMVFADDELYRDYLKDNGIDADKYMDPEEPLALTYDVLFHYDIEKTRNIKGHFFLTDDVKDAKLNYDYTPQGYQYAINESGNGMARFVKMGNNTSDDPEEIYLTKEEIHPKYDIKIGKRI
ncbi:MAG: ABC transporter permease, partial [Ruminococcus sp.]|nr:ABC transporter permease [Ruminococcus sp.]